MARPRLASIQIATPERLLAAAEDVFGARGLDGATLADVAARAGITRAALLYHFDSKERLYAEVVGRAFASLAEILASAMAAEGPFVERLRSVVEAFLTYVAVRPGLARIVLRELISDVGPGKSLVLSLGVPVLDDVVAFLEREGRGSIKKGIPVRPALLQIISDVFVRAGARSVRTALWGDVDYTWTFAQTLLLDPLLSRAPTHAPRLRIEGP